MAKQTLVKSSWDKDKKELDSKRSGYWDYLTALARIVESGSYLEEFKTLEGFLNHEGTNPSSFRRQRTVCEVRQRLGQVGADTTQLNNQTLMLEVSKVDEKNQTKVFASASELAELENRALTTKDIRNAAKQFAKPEPDPDHEQDPEQDEGDTDEEPGQDEGYEYEDVEDEEEPEDPPEASPVSDEFGRPVPKALKAQQALKAPLASLAGELNAIKRQVEDFYELPGGEFLERQKIRDQIQSLKYDIAKAGYLTECPDCKGAKCKTCEGARFIPARMKGQLSDAQKGWLGI